LSFVRGVWASIANREQLNLKGRIAMTAATERRSELKRGPSEQGLLAGVCHAIEGAQGYLLRIQKTDGHWYSELEGDTILESEYILTMYSLGLGDDRRVRKAANYIRQKSLPEGGWAIYPGGQPEVSASVKAYFVLKLLGDKPDAPHMKKARNAICDLGGLERVNCFTSIYLATFGQYPWERCPNVPPEIILIPKWFPVNVYEISAWSRCIIVPLAVISACRPHYPVPEGVSLSELWLGKPFRVSTRLGFWESFFHCTDAILKFLERRRWTPLRTKALKACEDWIVDHLRNSDGLGAIFPPIVNSIIALRCLGYDRDHSLTRSQIRELEKLEIEEGETLRVAPCFSPVWDTALASTALVDSGLSPGHPVLQKAGAWLLSKEVKEIGDWKIKNPAGQPGGWYFEYTNPLYPDVDDTFQVLTALSKIRLAGESGETLKHGAMQRALRWALSMQNEDGGWGSFDRGCDKQFLTQIPFADHNAMIDPSTADVTGRGLEALAALGFNREHPVVQRSLAFLAREQQRDGSWFGRWGCNYIYGTWLALRGLKCVGVDLSKDRFLAGARWLQAIQNSDGGWGELPRSYEDPAFKGRGPSTPSQTAWALMALMAIGDYESPSVLRGIEYLLEMQRDEGSWKDEYWTGTGFPGVFYLRYHLYATYFPLLALGLFKQRVSSPQSP
jgi:squalene-hopene/tetraprenyl-beta-curcumene cyclase